MAMSTARKTLDFENEFVRVRDAIGAALGATAHDAASARDMTHDGADHPPVDATIESSSGSQD
jgi:cytochrome c biogenesis protein